VIARLGLLGVLCLALAGCHTFAGFAALSLADQVTIGATAAGGIAAAGNLAVNADHACREDGGCKAVPLPP